MNAIAELFDSLFMRGAKKDSIWLFIVGQTIMNILAGLTLIFLANIGAMYLPANSRAYLEDYAGLPTIIITIVMIWVHEMSHLYAFFQNGAPTLSFIFPPFGGVMAFGKTISKKGMLNGILAGPMTGIIGLPLLIYGKYFCQGRVGIAYIFVGLLWISTNLLNLLPMSPLDGGQFLKEVLEIKIKSKLPEQILKATLYIFIATLTGILIYLHLAWLAVAQVIALTIVIALDNYVGKWFANYCKTLPDPINTEITNEDITKILTTYVVMIVVFGGLIAWGITMIAF